MAMQHLRDQMLRLHPEWDYRLWTLDNIPVIQNRSAYDFFKTNMFKSDVVRYEILYQHGGVYVDTDFLFLQNIKPLLEDTDHLLIAQMDKGKTGWINNAMMAFEPRHYFMKHLIDGIPDMLQKGIRQIGRVSDLTIGLHISGPIYLTKQSNVLQNRLVAHKRLFCGMPYGDTKTGLDKYYPDAYAIHLWASIWKEKGLDEAKILRAIKTHRRSPREDRRCAEEEEEERTSD